MIRVVLNLPWSILALVASFISIPHSWALHRRPIALVISVRSFWYLRQGVRAVTLGNIILVGNHLEKYDLQHELIHIEQHLSEPFVHPFLSLYQQLRYGYKNSKYEREAYNKAQNIYRK